MISNAFWLLTTLVGLAILIRFEAGVEAAINWKLCRLTKSKQKVECKSHAKDACKKGDLTPSLRVTA